MSDTPINPFDNAEEIAKKSMVLFFVIDCSGSMSGSKIGTVNSVMEELIPEIRDIGGADADIKLAVLKFSGGCEWMYDAPVSIDEFEWKPLEAENVTDLGAALTELASKLSRNEFMKSPSLSFAPVMILMSDGYPTDNYVKGLDTMQRTAGTPTESRRLSPSARTRIWISWRSSPGIPAAWLQPTTGKPWRS